jgi:hypothetical protein
MAGKNIVTFQGISALTGYNINVYIIETGNRG